MPHPYWHRYKAAIEKENKKEEWEAAFDARFRTSHVWEDAENNRHSVVHNLKDFIRDLLSHATKEAGEEGYAQAINEIQCSVDEMANRSLRVRNSRPFEEAHSG